MHYIILQYSLSYYMHVVNVLVASWAFVSGRSWLEWQESGSDGKKHIFLKYTFKLCIDLYYYTWPKFTVSINKQKPNQSFKNIVYIVL